MHSWPSLLPTFALLYLFLSSFTSFTFDPLRELKICMLANGTMVGACKLPGPEFNPSNRSQKFLNNIISRLDFEAVMME